MISRLPPFFKRLAASRWLRPVIKLLRHPRVKPLLLVTSVYTLLTIIVSYPVAFDISAGIAGNPGDSFQHLWLLWWAEKAVIDLSTTLADVTYLYFPQTGYHPILQVTPLIQFFALPFVTLFGPIVSYNLGFLATHILSGVTLYLLAYEVTKNHFAAFLGGLIFAFAPTRWIHGAGHYAQIMTYMFPLYFLFLTRLLKRPSFRNVLLSTITLALSILVNFVHVAYFVVPTTLILVGYFAWSQWDEFRSPRTFFSLVIVAVGAGLLTAPFLTPFLAQQSSGNLGYLRSPGVSEFGADLLAFFVPSPTHPFFRNLPQLRRELLDISTRNVTEGVVYLGIIPLMIAGLGVFRKQRLSRPWLLVVVITLLFSLGPLLKINGEFASYTVDDKLSYFVMPYALLTELPLYDSARTPGRLNATTMFGLAILVAIGASTILATLRSKKISPYWLLLVLTPLILIEYLTLWPYPMARVPVPDFYEQIADEPGEFGILDYPLFLHPFTTIHSLDFPMYYQLIHERPIVGGYVWRMPPETEGTVQALNNLVAVHPSFDIVPLVAVAERAAVVAALDIRYVVVHKQDTQLRTRPMSSEELEETRVHLTAFFGEPIFEDEYILVFQTQVGDGDEVVAPWPADTQMVAIGENWDEVLVDSERAWRGMMGRETRLYVYGQHDGPQYLAFEAYTVNGPKTVEILVNDVSIGEMVVGAPRQFITPQFMLPQDLNSITFKFDEPCQHPENEDGSEELGPCHYVRVTGVEVVEPAGSWGENLIECTLANEATLLGYDLQSSAVSRGEMLDLTLYWEATNNIEEAYTVFTHVLDVEGQLVAQKDNVPVQGNYATDWWTDGEIVIDHIQIPIGEEVLAGGQYELVTGLYRWPSGERLQVGADCSAAAANQAIHLTSIEVTEP